MGSCCSVEIEREYPLEYHGGTRQPTATNRPSFGEYRCSCGRTWSSRLSWQHSYQICKRCKKSVYPRTLRELRPSDKTTDKVNPKEHAQELCQMCKELGQYCGNIGKSRINNARRAQTGRRKY